MAASGGYIFQIGSATLSMHSVSRPIVAALAFGALGLWILGSGRTAEADRLFVIVNRDAVLIAMAFAMVIVIATFEGGAKIAGGTDSSGYLSQARLWRAAG